MSSLITFNYFEFYSLSVGGIFPGESWSRASQFEISDEWVLIRNCFYYITQVSLSWNVSRTCSEYFTMHFIFWKPERVECQASLIYVRLLIFVFFFKGTQLLLSEYGKRLSWMIRPSVSELQEQLVWGTICLPQKLVYPFFVYILDHIKHSRRLQGPKRPMLFLPLTV